MARYKRITRKKSLKDPDEFESFWARSFAWVIDNRDKVLAPMLGVIVLALSVSGFVYYRQQKEISSYRDLAVALRAFPAPNSSANVDYRQVVDSLHHVTQKFSGSHAADVGELYSGHALYRKGDVEAAATSYRSVMKSAKGELTGELAGLGLAAALREQGKYSESNAVLDQLSRSDDNPFQEMIDMMRADNSELNGDKANALKEYRAFLETHPNSLSAETAKRKIVTLEGGS